MTRDRDFVQLLDRAGPPPQVPWITCGHTSNARMRDILRRTVANALLRLREGEPYVEITDSAWTVRSLRDDCTVFVSSNGQR